MGEFAATIERSKAKKCFSFRGLRSLTHDQGLGAPPSDPRYRLTFCALAMPPCQILNSKYATELRQ